MKLSFLNVGQGDSLIIQWLRDSEKQVAIIDCKNDKVGGYDNSTINYLKLIKPKRIDFIILSHPHLDHCSGVYDLVEYLVNQKIPITHFYITASVSPNRILMSIKGVQAKSEITRLFKYLHDLHKKEVLEIFLMNATGFDMQLNNEWSLKILSPSLTEINNYTSTADFSILESEEESGNEPKGNLLSSFLAFYTDTNYFLLTADSTANTFYRIDKSYKSFFNSRKILLGQIAHHGSVKNFKSEFWKKKNLAKEPIPAVISVGKNIYNHPTQSVLVKLNDLGYEINLTEDLTIIRSQNTKVSSILNTISKAKIKKSNLTGISFNFEDGKVVKESI